MLYTETCSRYRKPPTCGFSLAEAAIVLGVIGLIIGGVWMIIGPVMATIRVHEAEEDLRVVVQNIRDYYAGRAGMPSNRTDMITAQLANTGVFPNNMLRSTNCHSMAGLPPLCPDAPWGSRNISSGFTDNTGTFFVCDWFPGYAGAWCGDFPTSNSPMQQFGIEIEDPPPPSCVQFAVDESSPSAPTGLVDIFINGQSMLALGHGFPVHPQDAITYCSTLPAGSQFGVGMVFVYRLRLPMQ
jgi:hypothetical protein